MRRPIAVLAASLVVATTAFVTPSAAAEPQSKFVEMFPQLSPFTSPTTQQLADLAQGMLDPNADSENNVGKLSIITYFGQFVDHDLTLDTTPSPLAPVNVATLPRNGRDAHLDLDSVYGSGPLGSPQLYEADGKHFRTQNPNPNGVADLPRNPNGSAILVEGRNDENQIISQIHNAWLRVHNQFVDQGMTFTQARVRTVQLYQQLILNVFLPSIVGRPTVDATLNDTVNRFYNPGNPNNPKMPVEFAVATYRFGHSQVRRAYRLQPGPLGAAGVNIQVFSPTAPDLRGGRQLTADRAIDWGNFVPELTRADNVASVNISRNIDPLISSSLFVLPIPGAEANGSNVLGFRNLVRGDFYGLPSGQSVAEQMGTPIISPEDLNLGPAFSNGTPLWFYCLAEASRLAGGATLGPACGRIVADVFVGVLETDRSSVLTAAPSGFGFGDLFVLAGLAQRP